MEHDGLCPRMANPQVLVTCQCDLIGQVRQDERDRIAASLYQWVIDVGLAEEE